MSLLLWLYIQKPLAKYRTLWGQALDQYKNGLIVTNQRGEWNSITLIRYQIYSFLVLAASTSPYFLHPFIDYCQLTARNAIL